MSFATLFTKLSAVEEDVKSAPRIVCENDKRGNSRKRKPQGEHRGLFKKKQRFQARTDTYNAASFKANDHHVPNTDSVHASSGFTKEVTHYQRNKASFPGQLRPEKNNNHNVNKPQQQTKKMEMQNNQYQMKIAGNKPTRADRQKAKETLNVEMANGMLKSNPQGL
ncbi:hypothetical protein Q5P01_026068 [Channa striata]|uniref:Uncharacterized protein n=1 Tax=Channa striata TaxID=64152 RepID=A0AA88IKN7_CHASR|nr:hypothetical protein Q5P01_026068 [Channa striata]